MVEDNFAKTVALSKLRNEVKGEYDYDTLMSVIESGYDMFRNKIMEIIRNSRGGIIYVLNEANQGILLNENSKKRFQFSRVTFNHNGINVFNEKAGKEGLWKIVDRKESWPELYHLIWEYGKEYSERLF